MMKNTKRWSRRNERYICEENQKEEHQEKNWTRNNNQQTNNFLANIMNELETSNIYEEGRKKSFFA
jgi:TATA-binding protein-associated factor Taf7